MNIRHRPGILFFLVGVTLLATGALVRRFVLPPISHDFLAVSTVAFVLSVAVTYLLYLPETRSTAE